MKIRCGSHQQNRSIVRPGLSLMAAKVALTAEEFRENSQRSIALFNTEKLSTNSTHVLKSAYCNSVHFCRCNLHGACGGKAFGRFRPFATSERLQSARSVWRQRCRYFIAFLLSSLQSARGVWRQSRPAGSIQYILHVAICTGRVEDLASSPRKKSEKIYADLLHFYSS